MIEANTKLCPKCNTVKDITNFGNNKIRIDGKAVYCKKCILTYNNLYRIDSRAIVNNLKKQCKYCTETDIVCLDFHHRDGTTKINTISRLKRGTCREKLLCEIEKCDVICANCHRKIHNGRILIPIN